MTIRPENPVERIVWRVMIWTWPFYAVGALYIVGPVLAWSLATIALVSLYLGNAIRPDLRATGPVPWVVWLWIAGMALMLVALWVGHIDWRLGLAKTVKSSIGWAKGWALLALFPLAGAVLPIRREILVRAQCIVGGWTLAIAPVLLIAPYVGLPEVIFVSPLKAVGGPGPEYFSVFLFKYDPATWTPRWQFYAPWSPFAALLGVVMVLFALEETHRKWKTIGVAAGILMILASKSRMGLVGLVVCTMGPRMLPLIVTSSAWLALSALSAAFALVGAQVIAAVNAAINAFKSARADSTRVRATLQRIGQERWAEEAVWFGHGTIQPGAHIVEFMPIGTHHTWVGLLFVKGLVGFCAFLVPFAANGLVAIQDALHSTRARLPLGILLTLLLLSFGENIEIEVYLLWPALVLLGRHQREIAEGKNLR